MRGFSTTDPAWNSSIVAFARRYFNALNGYFHRDDYRGLTLPWEVPFVGDQNRQAIILQHMMAGLNAHITFDLGLAVLAVAGNSLDSMEADFNRVNALLCSQIPGMLDVVQQLSPELRWARLLIPDEVGILKRMLMKLRKSAWLFAINMAMHPDSAMQKQVHQSAWTAALGAWYLQPTAAVDTDPASRSHHRQTREPQRRRQHPGARKESPIHPTS